MVVMLGLNAKIRTNKGVMANKDHVVENLCILLKMLMFLAVQFLIYKLISLLQLIEFVQVESIVCHRFSVLIV